MKMNNCKEQPYIAESDFERIDMLIEQKSRRDHSAHYFSQKFDLQNIGEMLH